MCLVFTNLFSKIFGWKGSENKDHACMATRQSKSSFPNESVSHCAVWGYLCRSNSCIRWDEFLLKEGPSSKGMSMSKYHTLWWSLFNSKLMHENLINTAIYSSKRHLQIPPTQMYCLAGYALLYGSFAVPKLPLRYTARRCYILYSWMIDEGEVLAWLALWVDLL